MEILVDNLGYIILFILVFVSLCLVSSSANRQLNRPILAYGGLALSGAFPVLLPIYLVGMFLKAKSTRLFIYLALLWICLAFLILSASKFSKSVELPDLYSGDITLEDGDYISIEEDFLKLHENQYVAQKDLNIGGTHTISNYYYYEIVPTNDDSYRKVSVFVTDLEIFNGKPPSENSVNRNRFYAYAAYMKNVDKGVVEEIRAALEPEQDLVFLTERTQSKFKSSQKTAKISSSIFGFLSLFFSILALREFKASRNQNL
jgi:hypothetical protein